MRRIVLVEDNEALRSAYSNLISRQKSHFNIIADFSSVEELLAANVLKDTHVVLMDIDLPGMSGIDGVLEVKKVNSQVEIIMLTVWSDTEKVFKSLENGAIGYVLKEASTQAITEAINELIAGGAPMSPAIARMVISKFHLNTSSPFSALEINVLKCLSEGKGYKSIAHELGMNSVDNVKYYIKKIYIEMQVHNREEAVKKAIQQKWI